MIYIIKEKATKEQIQAMMQMLQTYIKLAVDVDKEILSGGGAMHADCEAVLLEDGSKQEFIWGADWNPETQEVTFESLINIRPRQNNRSLELQNPELREKVERVTRKLLGDV